MPDHQTETRDVLTDLDDGYGGFDFNEALLKRAAAAIRERDAEIRRLRAELAKCDNDYRDMEAMYNPPREG
jgi:hypothetical protein